MPSRSQPRFTQASIACQIAWTRGDATWSASGRCAFSFSSISDEIAMPCSRACASSSSPVLNGYGTVTCSAGVLPSAGAPA